MENLNRTHNKWWLSTIIGILFIILGIWCLFTPLRTLLTVTYMIGFMFFFTGILEIFSVSTQDKKRGWSLFSGALDIIVGLLFLTMPAGEAILVTAFLFGFWVLLRSATALGIILNLRKLADNEKNSNWKIAISFPILGIVFGLIFLSSPMIAGGFIIGIFSMAIISFGIFELYWGIFLKKNDV